MLSAELDLTQIRTMSVELFPYLHEFPELFIVCIDPFPNTKDAQSLFGIHFNDYQKAIQRKQIIPIANLPKFFPTHQHLKHRIDIKFDEIKKLLLDSSYLIFFQKNQFFDEIAFILSQYGLINITDTRNEIIEDKGVALVRPDLESNMVEFENEINKRISGITWKIVLYLNKKIAPCAPGKACGLSTQHWEFRSARNLPHDRFWADPEKRIFITTSVGIELNSKHHPLVYRLSSKVRSKRRTFLDFV